MVNELALFLGFGWGELFTLFGLDCGLWFREGIGYLIGCSGGVGW
jgi:hypothetical protein